MKNEIKYKGSRHLHPDKRREQISQAAIKCFGIHGYSDTTVEMIATEAGLSKGSIYRFYSSKDEIMGAAFERYISDLESRINLHAEGQDALTSLYLLCKLTLDAFSEGSELMAVWVEFMRHDNSINLLRVYYAKLQARIDELLKAGKENGEVPTAVPYEAAGLVTSVIEGHIVLSNALSDFNALQQFERSWDVIKSGILSYQR
jgi:AcrR family transcriptional regulator